MQAMLSPFCLRLLPLTAALLSASWQCDAQAQSTPAPATNSNSSAAEVPDQRNARLIPFEVRINNAPGGPWTLLELGGALYATPDAFEEWRVSRNAAVQGVPYRGQTWFALSSVPGYTSRIDFANQSIDLVFSPSAFAATRLSSDAAALPAVTPSTPAVFVNFDTNYNQSEYTGAVSSRDLGLLTELGFTSSAGVLTSGFVGRNLVSGDASLSPSWRRLETTFTRDFPDQKVTLRLGDSSTRGSSSGRNVYFGGLQISRNFALAPGFLTQPIPVITGTSSAPSTVELYVNDALRQTSSVPTGPFAIDNFPLLTGGGQVRVVVRDVLGRETVVVQPFFSHGALLEAGLNDWSFELGAVRQNLGLENADYGQRFGAGLWRYGLNKLSTLETSGQWGRDTQNISLGISHALWGQSLGQISLASSHDRTAGSGREWSLGLENSGLRHSFNARVLGASQGYRQLGQQSDTLPSKIEAAANYTYSSDQWGSMGLGLAKIKTFDRGDLTTYSANYSVRVGAQSSLTLSATRVTGPSSGTSVGASLTIPLGERVVSSSNVNHRAGQTDAYTSVSRGLPGDTGVGWRTLAGSRSGKAYGEAGIYYQGSKALLTADASASAGQQSVRLGAQGAVVWIDGKVFASRRIQDSFALVEVPGYPDIGVGFQSSTQVRTDAAGYALLPRLQPYQRNSIRLDATELPINAELDNLEIITVPAARSAVKVRFPVRSGRAALIKIVMEDQQVAPAGAEIELIGDSKEFFVARRGEAFITGLQAQNTLRLKHDGNTCTVQVDMPAAKPDDIVRLGPLVCKGVKP
jgi:outer membrane usher protein